MLAQLLLQPTNKAGLQLTPTTNPFSVSATLHRDIAVRRRVLARGTVRCVYAHRRHHLSVRTKSSASTHQRGHALHQPAPRAPRNRRRLSDPCHNFSQMHCSEIIERTLMAMAQRCHCTCDSIVPRCHWRGTAVRGTAEPSAAEYAAAEIPRTRHGAFRESTTWWVAQHHDCDPVA